MAEYSTACDRISVWLLFTQQVSLCIHASQQPSGHLSRPWPTVVADRRLLFHCCLTRCNKSLSSVSATATAGSDHVTRARWSIGNILSFVIANFETNVNSQSLWTNQQACDILRRLRAYLTHAFYISAFRPPNRLYIRLTVKLRQQPVLTYKIGY
jgi:hypothetical protein